MRDILISSLLVSAVAVGATTEPPVDDEAQGRADGPITILPLLNDPSGTTITSFSAPTSGTGTVAQMGDQFIYTPNGFTGNDTFTYTTPCGTATVTVAVTAGTPTAADGVVAGLAALDRITTAENEPINIRVLDNDGPGAVLLGVNNPPLPLPEVTRGRVEINGNEIRYTPRPDFIGTDRFQYQNQVGNVTVVVVVAENIGDNPTTIQVTLENETDTPARIRITDLPGVFLECDDPDNALGFANLSRDPDLTDMEPFSRTDLCIEILNTNLPQSTSFQGEERGVVGAGEAGVVECDVSPGQAIIVTFVEVPAEVD